MAPTGPGTPSAYPYAAAPYGQPGAAHHPHGAGYPGYAVGPPAPGPGYGYGYGYQAPYGAAWGQHTRWPDNAQGTASLVLGIAGLVLCFSIVFGIVCGILAIVFGALARGKARRGEANNGNSALAGLIIGIVACVASVAMIFVYVAIGADDPDGDDSDDTYGSTDVRAILLLTTERRGEIPSAGV
ncbi:DUF4190 domain-containing protein [Streptomyces sp. 796.1]|uniref:DUF4190 domain-containing protein n=1 Tax=Streptomyces sp. 796.1 TaxID=3163029 RepID=UPI0039C929C5